MKPGLLMDAAQAGLYYLPTSQQPRLQEMATNAGLKLLTASLGNGKDSRETLRQLGKACHFPKWYGVNFDALHDCLTDPDWQAGESLVLQISGLDSLKKNDPLACSTLLEVLKSAASIRSAGKNPLWILLTSPATNVARLPVA